MSINLLPSKVKRSRKKVLLQKTSLWGSGALLVGVLAVTIGVFVFKLNLQREVRVLEDQIDAEKTSIRAQKDVEIKARALEAKIKALNVVLEEVPHYSVLLDNLASLLPEEVALSKLQVSSPDSARISGEALSYVDLARFLKALRDSEEEGLFVGIQLRSVNLDSRTGRVDFDLGLDVLEEKLYGGSE